METEDAGVFTRITSDRWGTLVLEDEVFVRPMDVDVIFIPALARRLMPGDSYSPGDYLVRNDLRGRSTALSESGVVPTRVDHRYYRFLRRTQ